MTTTETSEGTRFETARRAMIDSQLRTSGVNEPWVLARVAAVSREDFVPPELRHAAYIDRAVPLGEGRMLAAPLFHALALTEAKPTPADKVLLVGDGDGYLAALVRPLAGSLEAMAPEDAASAEGAGSHTLIIVDGAIEHLPHGLAAQLAEDGRIVTGIVNGAVTRLAAGRKIEGSVTLVGLAEMGIPRLAAFDKPARWSF